MPERCYGENAKWVGERKEGRTRREYRSGLKFFNTNDEEEEGEERISI